MTTRKYETLTVNFNEISCVSLNGVEIAYAGTRNVGWYNKPALVVCAYAPGSISIDRAEVYHRKNSEDVYAGRFREMGWVSDLDPKKPDPTKGFDIFRCEGESFRIGTDVRVTVKNASPNNPEIKIEYPSDIQPIISERSI